MIVGAAYKGFDDHMARWWTDRIISQECGQSWMYSWEEMAWNGSSSSCAHVDCDGSQFADHPRPHPTCLFLANFRIADDPDNMRTCLRLTRSQFPRFPTHPSEQIGNQRLNAHLVGRVFIGKAATVTPNGYSLLFPDCRQDARVTPAGRHHLGPPSGTAPGSRYDPGIVGR